MSPLKQIEPCGQSPWLDYLKRSLFESGELHTLIERDGLRGVTSNPSIFEKAIAETGEYANALKQFQAPQLKNFSGFSGEGRWAIEAAIEEAVPADVLSTALYASFHSRQEHTFGEKMLSAVRFCFGGHIEGNEPINPEPKSARSQGPSAAQNAAE